MRLKPRFLKICRHVRFWLFAARIIITSDEKVRTLRSVLAIKRAIAPYRAPVNAPQEDLRHEND